MRPSQSPFDLENGALAHPVFSRNGNRGLASGAFLKNGFDGFFRKFCTPVADSRIGARPAKAGWVSVVLPNRGTAFGASGLSNGVAVMRFAEPLASFWLAAYPAGGGAFVKFLVNWSSAKLKVLKSIVRPHAVDVVNQFRSLKGTLKRLAHHEPVFKNKACLGSVRMVRFSDVDIAKTINVPTAFPVWAKLRMLIRPFYPALSASWIRSWTIGFAWKAT